MARKLWKRKQRKRYQKLKVGECVFMFPQGFKTAMQDNIEIEIEIEINNNRIILKLKLKLITTGQINHMGPDILSKYKTNNGQGLEEMTS